MRMTITIMKKTTKTTQTITKTKTMAYPNNPLYMYVIYFYIFSLYINNIFFTLHKNRLWNS